MKKLLGFMAAIGLMVWAASSLHAGTPIDQGTMTPMVGPYSNTSVYGSTYTNTASASVIYTVSPASQGSTQCRTCFTKEVVQLSTAAVLYVQEAISGGTLATGTTIQYVQGYALGTSTSNGGAGILSLPENHLEPFCVAAGSTVTFNIVGTIVSPAVNNSVAWEGYTNCGPGNNSGK